MANLEARIERAIEELTGNEALLEMLDTDAALAMLDWGKAMTASVVKATNGMEDTAAEEAMLPRLKAVRQTMRSVGNWAAGKYSEPDSRIELRDKLLEYFRTIFDNKENLPTADQLDAVLNEVDDPNNTPLQFISNLKTLLKEAT